MVTPPIALSWEHYTNMENLFWTSSYPYQETYGGADRRPLGRAGFVETLVEESFLLEIEECLPGDAGRIRRKTFEPPSSM